MGIFDRIKSAIWGEEETATANERETASVTSTIAPDVAGTANNPGLQEVAASGAQPITPAAETRSATTPSTSMSSVDIAAQLDRAAAASGQKLDWRHSIVDLMKALGMDASLAERKELAAELNYAGDEHDSARMNVFLHKALMQKLAENGGKVPADLLD